MIIGKLITSSIYVLVHIADFQIGIRINVITAGQVAIHFYSKWHLKLTVAAAGNDDLLKAFIVLSCGWSCFLIQLNDSERWQRGDMLYLCPGSDKKRDRSK